MEREKVCTAHECVDSIESGATVGILGAGGGILEPDLLIQALADCFEETGSPTDLTLYHSLGLGDRGTRGLSPLARTDLVRKVIGGHWGQTPAMARLAERDEIEAYNLPSGVLSLLLREVAGGRPGLTTKIGMGTFIDPRLEGGRLNGTSQDELVRLVRIADEDWLFYPAARIDVSFVRGTRADAAGNVSLIDEPSYLDSYALAAATRACGGKVFAQVRELASPRSIHPKEVHIPGTLVDAVVVHPEQWQTYEARLDSAFAGHEDAAARTEAPALLDARSVIARRAALELASGDVVNLGVGIPDGVATVLDQEGAAGDVTFTVEHGIFGGVTAQGHVFGATVGHDAVVPMGDMFSFYHAGGLDTAFLGFAQVDRHGNANVSKFGGTVMGTGGFVDITQRARKVVLCGTLTAGGLKVAYDHGSATISQEGAVRKIVDQVDQITFSGEQASETAQQLVVVTDRAVFELTARGLTLTEVANGIDIEDDVLAQLGCSLPVADRVRRTEPEVLGSGPLSLAERMAERSRIGGSP